MDHLDPLRAALARLVPVPALAGHTDGRLLPRRRQDHRLVADGIPLRVRDAQRVAEATLLAVVRRVLPLPFGQRVALRVALGADVPACAAGGAAEQGVDHWSVADDHGDKGLAAGPAASLLGAVCAGLFSA